MDSACRVLWREIVSGSSRLRADREVVWDPAILTIGEYRGVLGVMVELSRGVLILCVPYQKMAFVLASPARCVEPSSMLLTLPGMEPNQPQSRRSDPSDRAPGAGARLWSGAGSRELEAEDTCCRAPPPLAHLLSHLGQVSPHLWAQFPHQ